jgi:D-serine deaminase-like pyridoxal phosphate-dependent protein
MGEQHWYTINDIDKLDTPALVTYPHRVKQNIDMLKYMIDDVYRLRPHVKTIKSMEVVQLMLVAGISKFKCATIAEAEMLGMCGARDVLLAYQPVGPKLGRFMRLIISYPDTKFSCLVDDQDIAAIISASAIKNSVRINIYIDLNVGMNRTGIAPGPKALMLYMFCNSLPGINQIGLHAYDGHIHDTDMEARTAACNAAYGPVSKLHQTIKDRGYPEPVIIAGGTPTFPIHAKRAAIECSPGTFVYWDRGYLNSFPEQQFLSAALIVACVVSLPTATTICIDCGHKSVAAENELSKRVFFLNAPDLKMIGQSEEHLVAEAGEGHHYKIGDVLYGMPWHICPTVALYERAVTVENNVITAEWKNIARDKKINI